MCMGQRRRERWVNARIWLLQREDELEKERKADLLRCNGTVNSAGVVYVKNLKKVCRT